MNVLIRVDSSRLMGSGHVLRCLVLASLLKKEGCNISFLCRDLPGNCYNFITEHGFEYHLLPFTAKQKNLYLQHLPCDDYQLWLGVSEEQDTLDTLSYLKHNATDFMVVDVYGLSILWETKIKSEVSKLMVIDDLANRQHDCDILLDHNFYINYDKRYNQLVPKECLKLLGPRYALINPQIYELKKQQCLPFKIQRIIIFLGGTDLKNYTDIIIDSFLKSTLSECQVDIVLGKANPHARNLIQKYSNVANLSFHIQPSYYYKLLHKADLSINAGGVSALERLYINLPSLIVCMAENQKQICLDLHHCNLAYYVENINQMTEILNNINMIMSILKDSTDMFPELNLSFIKELFNGINVRSLC
ncbi:putative polysaccharide biosynthesis protein [Legionella busanensis]|uniref:Putative polysaccharide biosynthesis protein n=1 Tax=Legionella busanensis TaxID=190655 RepID=A0A378JJJ6_9GAMM|nr:UDP-2,4-diacetamido-2,4,6-trideoxy-beta-L-altropyranose hydrolase [Legionella busanensis]STX51385.1 putative polysaccharide biosynthesis protein [Legionella busanensis]